MQQDKSINVREFMLLLKDCGVINADFGITDVMKIFLKANYELENDTQAIPGLEDSTPVDNLESEMIFAEFVEGIARVAHRVYHSMTRGTMAEMQEDGQAPPLIEPEPAEPDARMSLPERVKAFVQIQLASLSSKSKAIRKALSEKNRRRGSFMFV